jgi:hypothetical protein
LWVQSGVRGPKPGVVHPGPVSIHDS